MDRLELPTRAVGATFGVLAATVPAGVLSYQLFALAFAVAFLGQGAVLMTEEPPKKLRVAFGGAVTAGLAGAAATFLATFTAQTALHDLAIPEVVVISGAALLGLAGAKRVLTLANRVYDALLARISGERGGGSNA